MSPNNSKLNKPHGAAQDIFQDDSVSSSSISSVTETVSIFSSSTDNNGGRTGTSMSRSSTSTWSFQKSFFRGSTTSTVTTDHTCSGDEDTPMRRPLDNDSVMDHKIVRLNRKLKGMNDKRVNYPNSRLKAFLQAREWNVEKAATLMNSYTKFYRKCGFPDHFGSPAYEFLTIEKVESSLNTGVLTLLPETDHHGNHILQMKVNRFHPRVGDLNNLLLTGMYLIEKLLETPPQSSSSTLMTAITPQSSRTDSLDQITTVINTVAAAAEESDSEDEIVPAQLLTVLMKQRSSGECDPLFKDMKKLVFIADLADFDKTEHFSMSYVSKWFYMMQNAWPVYISSILIVDPPSWFVKVWNKVILPSLITSNDFANKLHFVDREKLANIIEKDLLTFELGGFISDKICIKNFIQHRRKIEKDRIAVHKLTMGSSTNYKIKRRSLFR